MTKARTPEGAVLAGALELLRLRGFTAWRLNSGAMRTPSGGFIRFGAVGMADVIGLVPGSGRLLACEIKAPKGKPRPSQVAFLEAVRAAGGVGVWVDNLKSLDAILATLRVEPTAEFSIDGECVYIDKT